MPYCKFFYHLVWATKRREPLLIDERVEVVRRALAAIATSCDTHVFAIGIMPDHVHLVVSIPPRYAVADVVQRMKGLSSRRINAAAANPREVFAWQPEYGALTFGERSLDDIVAYVTNQREVHARRELRPSYEQTERPYSPKEKPEPSPTP